MKNSIKKISLSILAFVAFLCMTLSVVMATPLFAKADVVQGTVPTFSTTKYQISLDNNNLLLVTGLKDLGDVYELGYNFFDENGQDANESVEKIKISTDKYFTGIKSGSKVWTVKELFGEDYDGMIVWEVAYDSAIDYTYQAYVKVGDRNDGQLVTSKTEAYGVKKLLSTTGASIASGTTYALVVPATTPSLVGFAAEEFNTLLKDVSGVELAIVKDNEQLPAGVKNYISLGKTSNLAEASTSTDYSALGEDGFAVSCVDKNIYIDANTDRGVLWGVYELLERYAGVRFLSQSYTYAPDKDIVKVDFEDFTCVPEFEQRDILAGHQNTSNYYYRITRYGEFGNTDWTSWATELGNIHTITDYYVLPSVWKASHPEFFSSYTNSDVYREDVCWSNGITDEGKLDTSMAVSVASIVRDRIIEQLKLTPEKQFFMLGIADQWNAQCKCETCLKRAVGKEGLWGSSIGAVDPTWGSYSGVTTAFCNAVVDAVNAWIAENGATYGIDHEVNVIEFAYYWSENAPVKKSGNTWVAYNDIVKPNDNVYVRIAPLNANFLYSYADNNNSKYRTIIEQWAAITDNLMLYDYAEKVNLITTWLPTLTYIQEQAQYLAEKDFYYWMFESDYTNKAQGLWYSNLLVYVLQELWWDVDADVDAIIDEFIELYHGEAASAYVKEFYNVMQGNMQAYINEGGNTMGVFGTDGIEVDAWSKATLDSAIAKLNAAINAVNADSSLSESERALYIKNINEALIIPKSIMLFNASTYALDNVDELKYEFKQLATSVGLTYVAYNNTTVDMFLAGIVGSCTHTEEIAWERTETRHKSYYPCCNAVVVALEDHEWSNGKCTECAYVCSHPEFDADDHCVICGSTCTHNSATDGYCDICGKCASTDYTNGVCNNCGATCEHVAYVDGYCAQCAMPCAHTFADGTCSICVDVQILVANGLTTSVENETLIYSINGAGQNITFDNVDGKKWLSFDFMMNSTQGYAYLQVGLNNYDMNIDIVQAVVKSTGEKVVFTATNWTGENVMQNGVWYTVLVNTNNQDFWFKHWASETGTTKIANINFLDISTTSGSALSIDSINGETVYTLVKTAGGNCNNYGDNAFWFTTGEAETLTFDFYSANFNYFQLCAGDGSGYMNFDVYNKVTVVNKATGENVPLDGSNPVWTGEVLPTSTWLTITIDVAGIPDLGIIFWASEAGTAQIKNIAFDNAQHKHTAFVSYVANEDTHKLVYTCCGEVIVEQAHNYVDGICSVCGYGDKVCEHDYVDGVCAECGETCEHVAYVDGYCAQCAMPCAHNFADGSCSICGDVQVLYANGITTSVENNTLIYSINGAGQNIVFDNVDGKKWLSFDFMMNSTQGYAYLQVGYETWAMNIDIVQAVVKATGEKVVFTAPNWSGENVMQNGVWYTVLVNTNGNDFYFMHWASETGTTKIANIKYLDISTKTGSALSIDSINGETVYTLVKTAGLGCNQYGDNAFWFTTGEAETLTFDLYSADFNYFQLCSGNGTGYVDFNVYNKVTVVNKATGENVPLDGSNPVWTGEVLPTNTWLTVTVDVAGIQDLGIIYWQSAEGTAQITNITLS